MRNDFIRAGIAGAFVGLSAFAQPPSGPPPAVVTLDAARMETIEQWRGVTGEILALRRSVVASRQEGQVVELMLEEGQKVQQGNPLARLDDALAKLEVAQREAELNAKRTGVDLRRVELEKARRDWTRYETLGGKAAVAELELDTARTNAAMAETALNSAEADVIASEAALNTAKERLSQRTILMPFSGRIARKATEVGEWVASGGAVAEIIALDEVEARLDVPDQLAAGLAEGSTVVRVRVPALDLEIASTVSHVMPMGDPMSRLVPVRLVLKNEAERLRPGMSVQGLIATGQSAPTLTIHKDAVLHDEGGEYVYCSVNGVAAAARVRTLFAVGDRVAVSGPVQPGAMLVTRGNEGMFPGQPLAPVGGAPPSPPKTPSPAGEGSTPNSR